MASRFAPRTLSPPGSAALDPKRGSPVADNLRLILNAPAIIVGKSAVSALGVEARGDSALIVNLERPAPYFPQVLSHSAAYPIYSDASARSHDPATWVSNGAYGSQHGRPARRSTLAKNPHYWNAPRCTYRASNMTWRAMAMCSSFAIGPVALDITDTVPENTVAELRREHSTEFVTAPYLATAYYGFNLTAGPCKGNRNCGKPCPWRLIEPGWWNPCPLDRRPPSGSCRRAPGTMDRSPGPGRIWAMRNEWRRRSACTRRRGIRSARRCIAAVV